MSVTYPEDRNDPITEENFIPVYARRGKAKKSSVSRAPVERASFAEPARVDADSRIEQPLMARRAAKSKKGVKTWMILAPIGVVVLAGAGYMMTMGGGEEAVQAPLAEPALTAPVLPATPAPTDAASAPLTSASTPAPVEAAAPTPAPAPVAREAAPVRRAAPVARRAAPAPAPAAAPVEAAPAQPTGPRAYSASPSTTSTLNAAPAAAPPPATPAPRAPAIATQPLN